MRPKPAIVLILAAGLLLSADISAPVGARALQNQLSNLAQADPNPFLGAEITISAKDSQQYGPAIAYNGQHNEYLVVWQEGQSGDGIYAQRIGMNGQILGLMPMPVAGEACPCREPAIAYDPINDRYLVVWMQDATGDGDWDLFGRFIPWEGPTSSLPEFPITKLAGAEAHPQVVYSSVQQEFMLVYAHHPNGSMASYIAGVRLYANGSGFAGFLTISAGPEPRDSPDVAYSGSIRNEYLVSWEVERDGDWDVQAVRLGANGLPLGDEFALASTAQDEGQPTVAYCEAADRYLIAWERIFSATDHGIMARFVTGAGALEGGEYVIHDTTAIETAPQVDCTPTGQHYLVTWQQQYSDGRYGVWARPVFTDKTFSPSFALAAPLAASERANPAVAGGSPFYLVAWEHDRPDTAYRDIHGRLVALYAAYLPYMIDRDR